MRSFNTLVKNSLNSSVEKVSMSNRRATANTINTFIANSTRNLIKDVISPNDITKSTLMIGVNCIYFNGRWSIKFSKRSTYKGIFNVNSKKQINVDFMKKMMMIKYQDEIVELNGAQAISLGYSTRDQGMLFILPPKDADLYTWSRELSNVDWIELENSMNFTNVDVTIPKFNLTFSTSLNDYLKNVSILQIF